MTTVAESEHRSIFIWDMMERLGIEPCCVPPRLGLSYVTALDRCRSCPSTQACRDWLDRMPGAVSFAPRFCPNADILFELGMENWARPSGPQAAAA